MKTKIILILSFILSCSIINAAVLPSGFAELRLVSQVDATSVKYSPDDRVFLVQKPGIINILQPGAANPTPTVCMDIRDKVDSFNERGAQSIAFDPDFKNNGLIYIYYTVRNAKHNRVSQFKVTGDVCDVASEKTIIDLDTLPNDSGYNNGGSIWFDDGKLFIVTGDGADNTLSQSFSSLLGKVLRINTDGSIPSDNPYYTKTTGKYRAIYALGLRNPYNTAIDPVTKKVFINDVGEATWEEINQLQAGANYGWPIIEGKRTTQNAPANYKDPGYAYKHDFTGPVMCAIVGATFYNPTDPEGTAFPDATYTGKYFFADYCSKTMYVLDPVAWTVSPTNFATEVSAAVSFDVAPNGDFFYLIRSGIVDNEERSQTSQTGEVYRVQYTGSDVPTFSYQPSATTTTVGRDVTFSCGASGKPLTYEWALEGVAISNSNAASYKVVAPTAADNGKKLKVTVTDGTNPITSSEVTLTVVTNTNPVPTITTPAAGATYSAGTDLLFEGTATDTEDGTLYGYSFAWKVALYKDDQAVSNFDVDKTMYSKYTIPSVSETSTNVFYRVTLKVTDFSGGIATVTRDVTPNKASVTLTTIPEGFKIKLDGVEVTTPHTFEGVVGIQRNLDAFKQEVNGTKYELQSWSDNGATSHNILTPATDMTYTATFKEASDGLSGGAIAGIVIGCVVFVLFVAGSFWYYKKRVAKRSNAYATTQGNGTANPKEMARLPSFDPVEGSNLAPQSEGTHLNNQEEP